MLKLIKDIQERAEMDAWYSRNARARGEFENAVILQRLSAREYAEARGLLASWFDRITPEDAGLISPIAEAAE